MKDSNSIVKILRSGALFLAMAVTIFGCQSLTGPESADDETLVVQEKASGWTTGVEGIEAISIVYSRVCLLREVNGARKWVNVDVSGLSREERTFDLLTVLDGFEAILGDVTVEPGVYLKMHVRVKRASITVNGKVSPLKITGNRILLKEEFEVGPSGLPALPLDFNAAEAVTVKSKGRLSYKLKAVFHLGVAPDVLQVGTISGVIIPSVYALVKVYQSGTNALVASVYADSDSNGFIFAHIPVGVYDLEASAPGYYSAWEAGVVLNAGELSDGHELVLEEEGGGEKR